MITFSGAASPGCNGLQWLTTYTLKMLYCLLQIIRLFRLSLDRTFRSISYLCLFVPTTLRQWYRYPCHGHRCYTQTIRQRSSLRMFTYLSWPHKPAWDLASPSRQCWLPSLCFLVQRGCPLPLEVHNHSALRTFFGQYYEKREKYIFLGVTLKVFHSVSKSKNSKTLKLWSKLYVNKMRLTGSNETFHTHSDRKRLGCVPTCVRPLPV